MKQQRDQVREAGDKWLNNLPESRRAQVLGRKGLKAWNAGKDWQGILSRYNGVSGLKSRIAETQGENRKIEITQKMIGRLRGVAFPGFSKQENVTMRELHKQLLSYAMKKNNHKEVAFILSNDLKNLQTIKGEENSIDISASVDSLLREHENIQILHNHPLGTSFSLRDINLLLEYKNVQGFSLITNSGRVETLQKTTNYDRIIIGK